MPAETVSEERWACVLGTAVEGINVSDEGACILVVSRERYDTDADARKLPASGTSVRETALQFLEQAMREAERAGHIIAQMRRFAASREPIRQAVDLDALIDDVIELTLLNSPEGTQIARSLAPKLPPVVVDPIQIQQVLINLPRYALEPVKNQDAPEVGTDTVHADGAIILDVEENDPGVSPASVSAQFKMFSRSGCAGCGPNLALSKSIAQNHGGDLFVDAGGQARGARFTLRLPLVSRFLN
jgi:two-component system, LuxR family, sensor kinase FixL